MAPPAEGQTAWTEQVLYGFTGAADGAAPQAGLIADRDGALYGTAAGWVLQVSNRNWDYVLYMGAAVYLAGFVIWTQIDPVTPITWAKRGGPPAPQLIEEL